MLDTPENNKEAEKEWQELTEELGITEEMILSKEYDYLDED